MELDHVFICVPSARDGVAALTSAGFAEGGGNIHAGQGTANARFFFDNAYLELIWATDEAKITSSAVRPTALWERVRRRDTGACPFGICFRQTPGQRSGFPRSVWDYAAPFLADGTTIPMLTRPNRPSEPLVFILPGAPAPSDYPPDHRQPLQHDSGRNRITGVSLDLANPGVLSKELVSACAAGRIPLAQGENTCMHVELDHAARIQVHDFRPVLPLWIEG